MLDVKTPKKFDQQVGSRNDQDALDVLIAKDQIRDEPRERASETKDARARAPSGDGLLP